MYHEKGFSGDHPQHRNICLLIVLAAMNWVKGGPQLIAAAAARAGVQRAACSLALSRPQCPSALEGAAQCAEQGAEENGTVGVNRPLSHAWCLVWSRGWWSVTTQTGKGSQGPRGGERGGGGP